MGTASVHSGSNPGVEFDPSWFEFAPTPAPFESNSNTGIARQDVLLVVSLLEMTSLSSDDTSPSISDLFENAVRPLEGVKASVAGVCVFPPFLPMAGTWVRGAGVRTVAVAGGFPHGLCTRAARDLDIREAARLADEVDFPIPRYLALEHRWDELYREVKLCVAAAEGTPTKAILATGELPSSDLVYRAAMTCMMAGVSFVKSSTGKERINARLDSGTSICQAIRDYWERTGTAVGIKPAGGIRTVPEALQWVALVRERLGQQWITPERMRIGASALLGDLRRAYEGEASPSGPISY